MCVRRVWGMRETGSYEVDRVGFSVWASLRLTARQGHLEGNYDDGVHTAFVTATIGPAVERTPDR